MQCIHELLAAACHQQLVFLTFYYSKKTLIHWPSALEVVAPSTSSYFNQCDPYLCKINSIHGVNIYGGGIMLQNLTDMIIRKPHYQYHDPTIPYTVPN
eukprot:sb/3478910/